MSLLSIPGGNRGTGHFYLAKNRTFLLCVDTPSSKRSPEGKLHKGNLLKRATGLPFGGAAQVSLILSRMAAERCIECGSQRAGVGSFYFCLPCIEGSRKTTEVGYP